MRAARLWAATLGLGLIAAGALAAQVPDTAVADTARRDTTDFSALFLQSREEGRLRVATVPQLGRIELMPALTRTVFDRDTIEWHNAETVADLLTKVPGVFVRRGGWIGRPELPTFQGRGAGSVEYLLDGVPYLALGPDSVAVDPSLLPLSFLDRLEVERLPGLLRIHLFTRRHDRLPPRTRVAVASGDFDIARYQGSLEQRLGSGLGWALAAEHLAVPLSRDQQGPYSNTQGWLQLSYLPSPRLAASLQVFRSGPQRETIALGGAGGGDTLSAGLDGRRTDLHAVLTYAPRGTGLGARGSLVLGYSAWREDSTGLALGPVPPHQHLRLIDQSLWQLGALASHRGRRTSLDLQAWHRSRLTPLEARGAGSAMLGSALTGSVEAVYRRHGGGRSSRWITARGGVTLPLALRASALVRVGSAVAAPALPSDSASDLRDAAGLLSFERPRLALEVGYWRTAGSSPHGFTLYRGVPDLAPVPGASWLTVSARVAPRQWLVLDGWYSDPVGAAIGGQPPTHSVLNGTVQSKFLPTFRSGIFTLKLQGTIESWGTGVIGLDPAGQPVVLPGATFVRGLIQFQIGDFTAYYDRANLQGTDLAYVPGLPIIRFASTFGVRWEFSN